MASLASGGNSFLSSLSSFFGGSSTSSTSSSGSGNKNAAARDGRSPFSVGQRAGSGGHGGGYGVNGNYSSGYGYTARRAGANGGVGGGGDDWALPYTHYDGGPSAGGSGGGGAYDLSGESNAKGAAAAAGGTASYPPTRPYGTPTANASLAEFTNMNQPNASTSHLVSSFARSRPELRIDGALSGGGANGSGPNGIPFHGQPSGGSGSGAQGHTAISSNMPSSAYPSVRHTWRRIQGWCEAQYPELWDTVNYATTELELDAFQQAIRSALPQSVRDSFLCHNGQELESYSNSSGGGSCQDGLFFGMPMLSLEQALQEWRFWREVDRDPETGANESVRAAMSSCPDGWIRAAYSDRGWLPLITDRVGNYIGVDLNPPSALEQQHDGFHGARRRNYRGDLPESSEDTVGDEAEERLRVRLANTSLDDEADTTRESITSESTAFANGAAGPRSSSATARPGDSFASGSKSGTGAGAAPGGSWGQVIVFGRDFDTKVVLWRGEGSGGWGRFLQYFAEELEAGEMWTLDDTSNSSEDEEDNIGYEGYFASGGGSGSGRGGGDRGGDGHAGFRLHGDYKGWPPLEAWADRSIRAWEEIGYQVGIPLNQDPNFAAGFIDEPYAYQQEQQQQQQQGEDDGQYEGQRQAAPVLQLPASDSREQDVAAPPDTPGVDDTAPLVEAETKLDDPLQSNAGASTSALDAPQRSAADSLSPPPHSSRAGASSRAAGKQREGAEPAAVVRRKLPPPTPASALDLPTLDDVRAAHAAALAESGGGSHRFALDQKEDLERHSKGSFESGWGLGGRRRGDESVSSGSSALQGVVVDPASISPRPSNGGFERQAPYSSRYAASAVASSTGLVGGASTPPHAPGSPRATDGFGSLIDSNSRPTSPSGGSRRPANLNKSNADALVDSAQPSPLFLQSFAGSASTGSPGLTAQSLSDADGRGSAKPVLRATPTSSYANSNSINGAMPVA